VGNNPRILILGSMPGQISLQMQQYYAHPRNTFWKIIFKMLNTLDTDDYQLKIELLKEHSIALWDVLAFCERQGSLDSLISNEKANDIALFLDTYSHIKAIFFNGQSSYKFFKKHMPNVLKTREYHVLPSTSPANASMNYEDKYSAWKVILNYI
jgi:hypoxanthine-DNA glycosylase